MADVAPVFFKKRAGKGANVKKRPATPPADSDSEYSSEEEGVRVKRRRKGGLTSALITTQASQDLSKTTNFTGDRSATITNLDDATKQSNWFEADIADPTKKPQAKQDSTSIGSYSGSANYSTFAEKRSAVAQRTVGPVKGPSNIRTITVTDFAPDVCKDYKQTGFCGFGDSCKFLHAREDYKQGWQLDKEWENVTRGKKLAGTTVASANRDAAKAEDEGEEESMLENIPFACIICKEPYKSPVVTKCGHYFCEACALKRYKQKGGKACANCGSDTGGTFNVAKNLKKLLDKKRERIRRQKEKAIEEGLDIGSEDEG